jgi:hypothetical protein
MGLEGLEHLLILATYVEVCLSWLDNLGVSHGLGLGM